jgi:hypothetical protein
MFGKERLLVLIVAGGLTVGSLPNRTSNQEVAASSLFAECFNFLKCIIIDAKLVESSTPFWKGRSLTFSQAATNCAGWKSGLTMVSGTFEGDGG